MEEEMGMSIVIPCMKNRGRYKTCCKNDQQDVCKDLITYTHTKIKTCSKSSYVSIYFERTKQVWYKWSLCVILHSMWAHRMAYSVSCLCEQVENRPDTKTQSEGRKKILLFQLTGVQKLCKCHTSQLYTTLMSHESSLLNSIHLYNRNWRAIYSLLFPSHTLLKNVGCHIHLTLLLGVRFHYCISSWNCVVYKANRLLFVHVMVIHSVVRWDTGK